MLAKSSKGEVNGPTSAVLIPCLAANPHLLSLSDGWSSGWQSSNPTCGYPAVLGYLGEEVNIAFMGLTSF